jgi:hypothetical protein
LLKLPKLLIFLKLLKLLLNCNDSRKNDLTRKANWREVVEIMGWWMDGWK